MMLQDMVVLKRLPDLFEVIKLTPPHAFPAWLGQSRVFFLAQTSDEYSIMCEKTCVPEALRSGVNWHCFRIDGDIAPDQSGVAASVAQPLADAGLSLILVGTHDRDYVLVDEAVLESAVKVYQAHGFTVSS